MKCHSDTMANNIRVSLSVAAAQAKHSQQTNMKTETEPKVLLPKPPAGCQWQYRGKGWNNDHMPATYIVMHEDGKILHRTDVAPGRIPFCHYWEAVKTPDDIVLQMQNEIDRLRNALSGMKSLIEVTDTHGWINQDQRRSVIKGLAEALNPPAGPDYTEGGKYKMLQPGVDRIHAGDQCMCGTNSWRSFHVQVHGEILNMGPARRLVQNDATVDEDYAVKAKAALRELVEYGPPRWELEKQRLDKLVDYIIAAAKQ
jgi:hypothetical protein